MQHHNEAIIPASAQQGMDVPDAPTDGRLVLAEPRYPMGRAEKAIALAGVLIAGAGITTGAGEATFNAGMKVASAANEHVVHPAIDPSGSMVEKNLKMFQAEHIGTIKTKSGILAKLYRSKLDAKQEPLTVNAEALGNLTDVVIDQAQDIEGSPVNQQMAELKKQAKEGAVGLELDIVLVSDEKLCLPQRIAKDVPVFVPTDANTCYATGRAHAIDLKNGNDRQFIVALDHGTIVPKKYYSEKIQQEGALLTPDQMFNVVLAHEMGHALFHYVDKKKPVTGAVEHKTFVNKIEARTYELMTQLRKGEVTPILKHPGDITAVHVEDNAEGQDVGIYRMSQPQKTAQANKR